MKWTKKRIMMVIGVILLMGGATVIIITGVEHYQEIQAGRAKKEAAEEKAEKIKEKQSKKSEEAEMRHNVALWAVQNLEGEKPITDIKVDNVDSAGVGGTGGYTVGVKINNKKNNEISLGMQDKDTPNGGCMYGEKFEYEVINKPNKNKTLKGVKVEKWEGQ